jgi:hypothetical protein
LYYALYFFLSTTQTTPKEIIIVVSSHPSFDARAVITTKKYGSGAAFARTPSIHRMEES